MNYILFKSLIFLDANFAFLGSGQIAISVNAWLDIQDCISPIILHLSNFIILSSYKVGRTRIQIAAFFLSNYLFESLFEIRHPGQLCNIRFQIRTKRQLDFFGINLRQRMNKF